jgi:predicted Zn-dependent peptidase
VVGDVEPDTVTAIAREVLGDENREVGQKIRGWNEPEACAASDVKDSMEVAMPMFSLLFKCPHPGHGEKGIRQEVIAEMACESLFGESSKLYQKLYEEGAIDTSFGGGFEVIDGCAMVMISGDSDEPEKIREAILAQAAMLTEEGIAKTDYDRMLRCALGTRIKGLDNFDATCFRLCAYHLTEFDYFDFPRIYESITVEEIRGFLSRYFREDNCALSVIYPNHQEETA